MNRRLAISVPLVLAAVCLVLLVANSSRAADPKPGAASGSKRPIEQIRSELAAAEKAAYERFFRESIVDPRFRVQMTRELVGPIRTHLGLLREFGQAQPAAAKDVRMHECNDLATLAVLGQADATQELEQMSTSTTPDIAVAGKAGLLMKDWWTKPDADVQAKVLEEFRALAQSNPNDDVMVGLLLTGARWGAASLELGNAARDIVESTLQGPAALKYKQRPDKIGRPLVIQGTTLTGKPFTSAAWKGKVVIVDFWATWCIPCREALPKVTKLYQDNHERGLEIVGVDNDANKMDVQKFLAQQKSVSWPQLFGPADKEGWHSLAKRFAVSGIPTMFLIDRNGVLRTIEYGRIPEKMILELLDETASAPPATAPATR